MFRGFDRRKLMQLIYLYRSPLESHLKTAREASLEPVSDRKAGAPSHKPFFRELASLRGLVFGHRL